MTNVNWSQKDFDVFLIEGLDERMDALTTIVRPKFHTLGDYFSSYFSAKTGDEFFTHVAKHARRTVNPPKDSWVAFAPYKRGYKSLPHFQIGLWNSHLFIVVAVIYEAPNKAEMAQRLLEEQQLVNNLHPTFVLSGDHMSPKTVALSEENAESLLTRLRDVKKGEFLAGRILTPEEASAMSHDEFIAFAEQTFEQLLPIYNVMVNK
jgi:uncharacterized protein YktB (UPF0637 family)